MNLRDTTLAVRCRRARYRNPVPPAVLAHAFVREQICNHQSVLREHLTRHGHQAARIEMVTSLLRGH
jgi:hypothetical protein